MNPIHFLAGLAVGILASYAVPRLRAKLKQRRKRRAMRCGLPRRLILENTRLDKRREHTADSNLTPAFWMVEGRKP